jgi:peptide/nickel transport system substrate-binding protein
MISTSDTNYWSRLAAGRLGRRQLLRAAVIGGAGTLGTGLLACGDGNKSGGASTRSTSGARAQDAQGAPQPGGTFRTYFTANYPLDPQKASALPQQAVGGVYSRLFRFKTGLDQDSFIDHDLENDLGTSIESPDAVTWTIKLRQDAKFHNVPPVNGHAVEAEDIKATFTRALDPATSNPNRGQLGMIDLSQIQMPDKNTVQFKLNYPYAPFRNILASPVYCMIYPREVLSGGYDPTKTVIGSGPFILDSVTPDVVSNYRKNPEYFEAGHPFVNSMRAAIIPDASQRLAQFTAGNLDELQIDDPNSLQEASQRNAKALVLKTEAAVPHSFFLQLGDPASAFQDIRVRRAFSLALDRDAIDKAVYNGQGQQVVLIPSYMGKWSLKVKDLQPSIQQYFKYNPSEAKKLLEAAGATDLQIKFSYANTTTPVVVKELEALNNMLKAVGIKSNLVEIDYNKDFIAGGKGVRNGFYPWNEIDVSGSPPFTEADEWLFSFYHSKSTTNTGNVRTPELDAMIGKERTILDENERLKAVLDIQRYVADQMYQVPTVGTYLWVLLHPRVQNFQFTNSLGYGTETNAKLWLKEQGLN